VTAKGHYPRLPTKVLRQARKVIGRGQSDTLNGSQLLLVAMMMTMTRRPMTLTSNTSLPPSMISATKRGSLLITLRIFSW
jgi:hypothetical protein